MFTSVASKFRAKANRQALKTGIVYLVLSVFCVVFDKIYALFGHGVHSAAMSLLFLFPLLGGAVPFILMWAFVPHASDVQNYRFSYNCYHSGIAALAAGSLLKGVLEIAGTSSPYLIAFTVCGWMLFAIGATVYFVNCYLSHRSRK